MKHIKLTIEIGPRLEGRISINALFWREMADWYKELIGGMLREFAPKEKGMGKEPEGGYKLTCQCGSPVAPGAKTLCKDCLLQPLPLESVVTEGKGE